MKLIYSFWTYPIRSRKEDKRNRLAGGWPHTRYHYLSWILSCLLAKKHHGKIDLYTDDYGKELLIDNLELPYNNVHVALNDLEKEYSSDLWTIGKTMTLKLVNEPFLHIDSDVYLFGKINRKILNGGLVCQNLTKNLDVYDNIFKEVHKLDHCPAYFKRNPKEDLISINAGVIGGNNLKRIHEIAEEVFNFVNSNKDCIHKIDNSELTLLIDQYIYYCLFDKKQINPLFDSVDQIFTEVLKWHVLPQKSRYVHALGFSKRNPHTIVQLESRLAYHFPDEYNRYAKKLELVNILEQKNDQVDRRFKAYSFLENSTFSEIIEKPIVLSPSHIVINGNIQNKATGEKIPLEGLNNVLPVFEEPTTMLEVVDYLKSLKVNESEEDISNRVYEFIMDKIIYHDQLTFD